MSKILVILGLTTMVLFPGSVLAESSSVHTSISVSSSSGGNTSSSNTVVQSSSKSSVKVQTSVNGEVIHDVDETYEDGSVHVESYVKSSDGEVSESLSISTTTSTTTSNASLNISEVKEKADELHKTLQGIFDSIREETGDDSSVEAYVREEENIHATSGTTTLSVEVKSTKKGDSSSLSIFINKLVAYVFTFFKI